MALLVLGLEVPLHLGIVSYVNLKYICIAHQCKSLSAIVKCIFKVRLRSSAAVIADFILQPS